MMDAKHVAHLYRTTEKLGRKMGATIAFEANPPREYEREWEEGRRGGWRERLRKFGRKDRGKGGEAGRDRKMSGSE